MSEDFGSSPLALESESGELTHKQAVRRMATWLKNVMGYNVVMAELTTSNPETPDVVGWSGSKGSILIEVKVSRADFHADKHKRFRQIAELGMGDRRYFAAPKGMLKPEDIPENWGLLEIAPRCVYTTVEAQRQDANKSAEVRMLCSVIRRLEISTAVFVRQEAPEIDVTRMDMSDTPQLQAAQGAASTGGARA